MTARPGITAIITSFNEEINIQECLESVLWADEVLLVDSFSTDRTVEIAKAIPKVQVVQHAYFGSAAQKNWAMDRAVGPWVLIVDADERVTAELSREILELLEKGPDADHY